MRAIIALGIGAAVGIVLQPLNGQDPNRRNVLIRSIESNATAVETLGPLYRELFKGVRLIELAEMRTRHGESIGIQAAWEKVRLLAGRQDQRLDEGTANRELSSWFIGYLEGRGKVVCPKWWRDLIVNAKLRRTGGGFPGEGASPSPAQSDVPRYEVAGLDGISAPVGTSVRRKGGAFELKIGADSIQVPNELFRTSTDGTVARCCVSGVFTESYCIIAVHTDGGNPHPVSCLERSSKGVMWTAKACGCWWGGLSGTQRSQVAVSVEGDCVVVYGCAAAGIYAHAFRLDTGESIFRFSSAF